MKTWLKGSLYGGAFGFILAVFNSLTLGIFGAIFYYLSFHELFEGIICSGETCWIWMIIIGNIGFILSGLIIGAIIGFIIQKVNMKAWLKGALCGLGIGFILAIIYSSIWGI